MDGKKIKCSLCDCGIPQEHTGEPYLEFKCKNICFNCYMELPRKIFEMEGYGDGGMIRLIFKELLKQTKA